MCPKGRALLKPLRALDRVVEGSPEGQESQARRERSVFEGLVEVRPEANLFHSPFGKSTPLDALVEPLSKW